MFAVHRIDEQLTKALDRKVWLPSGGTLVIDRTEAMTVVDVNTGKFTGSGGNLEETVTRNNLEAAEEIVRQLRLRDIGGIVVIDFIDMVLESNRDLVLRRLTECLGPRPHPPPGVRGDVAGLGAADPKAVGHRPDRGVFHAMPALRGPRESYCTAIRSTRRQRPAAKSDFAGAAASAARRAAAATTSLPSRRCPSIRPASTRCSRRWLRPTGATTTTIDGEVEDEDTQAAESRRARTRQPSSEAVVEVADEELEDEDFDESDEDESDEDESTRTKIDLTTTTMTTTSTTTSRSSTATSDDEDSRRGRVRRGSKTT